MRKLASTFTVAAALCALSAASHAQTVLKASHQFPGGKGDARDEMVQIIAREAKAANVGLEIQVYPGASLFKPNDQWNAMVNGQLDISSFPLDYASGKVGAFSATLMPGLVRNHERAARLNDSPFMKDIKAKIEKAGVVVLADAWLAGAVASKKGCIRKPDDIKGLKIRSAGPTFAAMWQQAGASIVSIPSNEVYNALQTGVADATDTSDRQLRLVPHLRAGEVHHRAGRQRAVVHVRAGADVEEELRQAQQAAAGRADQGRQEVGGVSSTRRPRGSTTTWSTPSRRTMSRSSR